ncbi:MAG: GNAT family N-acetyltransferase [Porticoccaceae bacterium]|nr:GNAT family N-acetyltransferase [Porticoccaceae bacterium]
MGYREMRIEDYDAVLALWKRCAGLGLRNADSWTGIDRYLQRNPGLSFVAEHSVVERSGEIVGTIMSGHDGKRGYVQHLAVDPKLREQGIGTTLHDLCMAALEKQDILKSHLMVYTDNLDAQQFWANRGWHMRDEIETMSYIAGEDPNV